MSAAPSTLTAAAAAAASAASSSSSTAASQCFQLASAPSSTRAPRLGELVGAVSGARLPTPNFLAYTLKGQPFHVTPDRVLAPLAQGSTADGCAPFGVHVSLPSLFSSSEEVLAAVREHAAQHGGSAHAFLNLEGALICMSVRDSLFPVNGPVINDEVTFDATTGRVRISNDTYLSWALAHQPDILVPLVDETRANAKAKRMHKALNRSEKWLSATTKALESSGSKSVVFGSIQGGKDRELRRLHAEFVAAQPVGGFVLGGLECGESPAERLALIDLMLDAIPAELPRLRLGQGNPLDVLAEVEHGVDLFEGTYPSMVAETASALTFSVDGSSQAPPKICLRDRAFEADFTPLVEGCSCEACQNYTRAYVHHLLNTGELLSKILLQVHNTHHYARFFAAVRASISSGTFAQFKEGFTRAFVAE